MSRPRNRLRYGPGLSPAAAAASNSLPDIIGLQLGSLTQQYREQLAPLNNYAEKEWGADWQSRIFPVNLKQMAMGNPPGDSSFYILPQESQILVIWYNKEIFKKLNVPVPKTYKDLVTASKSLSAGGYIPVYQGAADGWQNENVFLMLANQLAPGLVDDAQNGKAPWTSPQLVQAMHAWVNLFKDGVFQQGSLGARAYPTGAQLFAQGRDDGPRFMVDAREQISTTSFPVRSKYDWLRLFLFSGFARGWETESASWRNRYRLRIV